MSRLASPPLFSIGMANSDYAGLSTALAGTGTDLESLHIPTHFIASLLDKGTWPDAASIPVPLGEMSVDAYSNVLSRSKNAPEVSSTEWDQAIHAHKIKVAAADGQRQLYDQEIAASVKYLRTVRDQAGSICELMLKRCGPDITRELTSLGNYAVSAQHPVGVALCTNPTALWSVIKTLLYRADGGDPVNSVGRLLRQPHSPTSTFRERVNRQNVLLRRYKQVSQPPSAPDLKPTIGSTAPTIGIQTRSTTYYQTGTAPSVPSQTTANDPIVWYEARLVADIMFDYQLDVPQPLQEDAFLVLQSDIRRGITTVPSTFAELLTIYQIAEGVASAGNHDILLTRPKKMPPPVTATTLTDMPSIANLNISAPTVTTPAAPTPAAPVSTTTPTPKISDICSSTVSYLKWHTV